MSYCESPVCRKKISLELCFFCYFAGGLRETKGRDDYVRASIGTFYLIQRSRLPSSSLSAKQQPGNASLSWPAPHCPVSNTYCLFFFYFFFVSGDNTAAQACLLIDGEVSREHSSSVCKVWSHVARPFLSWIRTTYPARLSPIVLFYHWPFLNTSQVVISPSAAHQTLFKPARKKNSYLPQQWAHRLTLSGECWQRSQLPPVWTWGQA